jgi:hypothetical protein
VTTASELIRRSLRLINQPGRGAQLAPEDQSNALEALQEILDSEAVSKQFVPGIRRHFFPFVSGKSFYSYGNNPGADFNTSPFGNINPDPAPIKIEYGQVLAASNIIDNELIQEFRFQNVGNWTEVAPGEITNNELVIIDQGGVTIADPDIVPDLTGATTYTLRTIVEQNAGEVVITLYNNAVQFEQFILDSSGTYEFDFVWPAGIVPSIEILGQNLGADLRLALFSIIPRGLDRLQIPDGIGSYYHMIQSDQNSYNRYFTKGNLGRPYHYLYTRSAGPLGELRFDNSGVSGDIVVFDVLVNTVQVYNLSDTLQLSPQSIKWLRYALADNVSSEYGKNLNQRQITIMEDAWNKLAAGNRRMNMLGVPRGLRQRQRFDINRGDP